MPSGSRRVVRRLLAGTTAAAGAALTAFGYASVVEVDSFRLRRVVVAALPPGRTPIRVLHLSDLHLLPSQREKQAWVAGLAALEPDLVVDTGDNVAHPEALPYLLRSLGGLLDRPGVYVMGSNDYYAPKFKNPFIYFARREGPPPVPERDLPWQDMIAAFDRRGWHGLTNRRDTLIINGTVIEFRGTDDPHLELDEYQAVAGPPHPEAELAVGVTHAPYLRVLDAMVADGVQLIMAGHTHGGQVCVPGFGALVTNCDLDRHRVKGLSEHRGAALHVSAGLGTSPWAPIRFACPPEATLLTLVPRS